MNSLDPLGPAVSAAAAKATPREQVRVLAHQLEGVFLNQLFQAMRASVPQDGTIDPAPGQEMFTQMFDESMASEAARKMTHGIGEALYRQMAANLPPDPPTEER